MVNFDPTTGKWTDSSGGEHDSRNQAQRWETNIGGGGGGNFSNAAAGVAMNILFYLIIGFAVIVFVVDNIWYGLILGAVYVVGWFARRYAKYSMKNAFARFGVRVLTWLVFIIAAYGCLYNKNMKIDPAITAVATINEDVEIRKATPLLKTIKGKLKEGDQVTVLGITRNKKSLKVQTTTPKGKVISGLVPRGYADGVVTAFHRSFAQRVWNGEFKDRLFFLDVGTYESDKGDEYLLAMSKAGRIQIKELNSSGKERHTAWAIDEKFIKAEPFVEIDGIPYCYKMILTLDDDMDWYAKNEMTPPPPELIETLQGEYVITSNKTFVGNGRTWTLRKN
ncbi:hypothetical protein LJC30_04610 [Odoribacter sp. OttesenSCG-928-L07]|nr:hypothetical protein [Odoribacter sp. OttesenSCG-928-L07]MDL2239086.1 hypothetical protein [Bacteroidales bacterium OttesenSCG-928-L14]MDL2239999.1 hypothetical protein [Bacteroidales bacterium OttesenSCG-928-K22]